MEIGILVLLIPLALYLFSAFSVGTNFKEKVDSYFIAYKEVNTNAFSNSSIAYAFQVATVYLFLVLTISDLILIPLLNAIFWGLGIFWFAKKGLPKIKSFIGSQLTLHGYLGNSYKSSSIKIYTSILSIIGLLGVAVAEIVWGAKVLMPLINDINVYYLLIFLMTIYVLVYVSFGGQRSSIRTDQIQLVVSYVGIYGTLIYLFYILLKSNTEISPMTSIFIVILIISLISLLIIRKFKFIQTDEASNNFSIINNFLSRFSNILINVFLIALLIFCFIYIPRLNFTGFPFESFLNIEGFGIMGVLSVSLLPFVWQFVDMSNWQRILSVKVNEINGDYKEISRGLRTYAIESPISWLIFIVLGLLLISANPSLIEFTYILIDIPKYFLSSNFILENIVGYLFIVSIVSIMLSTVDSIILAAMFTFIYDTNKKTSSLLSKDRQSLSQLDNDKILIWGRLFGLIFILSGVSLFVLFDLIGKSGESFIGLLFAFYTAQLSFFPAVLGALYYKNKPRNIFVILSIIVSAIVGVLIGIYGSFFDQTYQWYPVVCTLFLGFLIYSLGYINYSKGVEYGS